MARKEITIIEISKLLSINRYTVSRKLSGKSKLYLNEVMNNLMIFENQYFGRIRSVEINDEG